MFRNYLVTACKVLLRRKFFSFVNLFGIALTLAVLTVVIAMLQNYLRPLGAEAQSDHYLAVRNVRLTNDDRSSSYTWAAGYRFLERHVLPLEEPDRIGIVSSPAEGTVFAGGSKLSPSVVQTDDGFWDIMRYDFLEGSGFGGDDIAAGRTVAVINAAMRAAIFGGAPATGETFQLNGRRFQVVGVVANEPENRVDAFGEIWIPYSAAPTDDWRREWIGPFTALLYAQDPARLPAIRAEFVAGLADFAHEEPERFTLVEATADSKLDNIARDLLNRRFQRDSGAGLFLLALFGGMVAFMFLPTINLINLNVSRILERAGEIGVRKAFGASHRTLVGQFLVENLVLSLLGGLVGIVLGLCLLELLEFSGLIAYGSFELDLAIFGGAFLMIVVFALVSGIYPAVRMARMHPVAALRRS